MNHDLTVPAKVAVYKAICISILLYGSESWNPYRRHIRMLEAFHIRCLQSILCIRWWHRKTHIETHNTANIQPIEHLVSIAAETTPLARPRHPYAVKPASSSPTVWRTAHWTEASRCPKLRFSNHIKSVLRKCDIPEADLEQLAADGDSWRSTCATGLKSFAAASD